jgi:hypothetical protein
MPTYQAHFRVARPPADVFDVIGTNCYRNHPRWEREVVEIRPLTDGPIGLGSRAIMVRQEYGRRSEVAYEVTAFEPGRRIAFRHLGGSMTFELAFELTPLPGDATDLRVDVRMEPHGMLRLMTPLLALRMPGTSRRISRSMVELVESEPPRVDA